MEPGDDAVRRLAAMGITAPKVVQWVANRPRLIEFMEERVRPTAESLAAYAEWMPRLREFAAARRVEVPVPDLRELNAAESAEHRMLLMRMREFQANGMSGGTFVPKPDVIREVSTTRVGLSAAVEAFAAMDVVIMTSDEWKQWHALTRASRPSRDSLRSEMAWWYRVDTTDPHALRHFASTAPPPTGVVEWLFSRGTCSGSGDAGRLERWWWDGEQLAFVEQGGPWIS